MRKKSDRIRKKTYPRYAKPAQLITANMVAANLRSYRPESPTIEQRIWFAVVERALRDALGYGADLDKKDANFKENAQDFIASSAFDDACEIAGLCPHMVRRAFNRIGQPLEDAHKNALNKMYKAAS